jgi:plastocyanin
MKRILSLVIILSSFVSIVGAEYEVAQKDKKFTKDKLTIKVGESVNFPNQDTFFHNVFSLSPIKIFDLGSYPKGQSRKVTFDKAGKVVVECAIHPEMKMTIEVTK